jgi:hypothetical protein
MGTLTLPASGVKVGTLPMRLRSQSRSIRPACLGGIGTGQSRLLTYCIGDPWAIRCSQHVALPTALAPGDSSAGRRSSVSGGVPSSPDEQLSAG